MGTSPVLVQVPHAVPHPGAALVLQSAGGQALGHNGRMDGDRVLDPAQRTRISWSPRHPAAP